jgi:hypothetical protein
MVMKDSHHCCSVWLKIMTILNLCKIYLSSDTFFSSAFHNLRTILIVPQLASLDLLYGHLRDELHMQMQTVIGSLLFSVFYVFYKSFVLLFYILDFGLQIS